MLRRVTLPILVAYGLWILWAASSMLHELSVLAANPTSLAFAIAMRECGFGGGDLMKLDCGGRTLREVMGSIGEPSLGTALWRMRGSYAELIFIPPMWFVSKAVIGVAVCYLCMIAWRMGRRRKVRLQPSRTLREWRATRDLNWPFNR